ncbi:MAG TPA: DNA double-strand break repair nuclease NurA [Acidimicrobiales bacterium]|nr:DNA double-strand break repair nuclease NurA [Acidimicrobiales bacterium]
MTAITDTATRLARLLTAGGDALRDPTGSGLVFEPLIDLGPLERQAPPPDVWAVDGGQALVADARTVQLYVTRAATVRWRDGAVVSEDEGELRAHLVGAGEERRSLAALGSPVAPDAAVDVNLLRDWGEWAAVAAAVDAAEPEALVLVDGDLQPDWRIPSQWLADLLARAAERRVTLAGVTKHSSLALGGAPLLGVLERRAERELGPRTRWWAKVATTRPDVGAGLVVVVARLDPDAPFAFRVDLPAGADPAAVLGSLAALSDDAAFPGYPYPLTVADRLAACPGWLRQDIWDQVEAGLAGAGVPADVRDRAFTDRHRLMERS